MAEERVSTSLQTLLDQQPDLKELTEHARTARWYQLGVQLELDSVDLRGCTDIAGMYGFVVINRYIWRELLLS